MLIVSAREFSQLNANRLFNGNMCPIAFRSARGNSRVDCFGIGGCLSLPLPRSGEGVWSLWFDAHAGGLADVSLTQVPQPPRSPPRLVVPSDLWICLAWGICPASPRVKALHQGTSPLPLRQTSTLINRRWPRGYHTPRYVHTKRLSGAHFLRERT